MCICYTFDMKQINRTIAIAVAALGGFAASAGLSQAASPIAEVVCAPTGDLYTRLETRMGSKRIATGLRGREQIMEVWSDNRGEWVMVVTYASGQSCIVAMGEDWMPVGPAPARG